MRAAGRSSHCVVACAKIEEDGILRDVGIAQITDINAVARGTQVHLDGFDIVDRDIRGCRRIESQLHCAIVITDEQNGRLIDRVALDGKRVVSGAADYLDVARSDDSLRAIEGNDDFIIDIVVDQIIVIVIINKVIFTGTTVEAAVAVVTCDGIGESAGAPPVPPCCRRLRPTAPETRARRCWRVPEWSETSE